MRKFRWLFISIISLSAWIFIHCIIITLDGLNNDTCTTDVGVILGNRVYKDGTLSPMLETRLACGLNLFQTGNIKHIIVSGGLGKEGYYEGDKMRGYLIIHHVPDSIIIVDNKGDNTRKTAENTAIIAQQKGYKSITVISQFYHISRCKMLFKKNALKNICSAAPKSYWVQDIYSLFREFWAYYFEVWQGG